MTEHSPTIRELADLTPQPGQVDDVLAAAVAANPGLVLQALREAGVHRRAEGAELRKLRRVVAGVVDRLGDRLGDAGLVCDCVSDLADALGWPSGGRPAGWEP